MCARRKSFLRNSLGCNRQILPTAVQWRAWHQHLAASEFANIHCAQRWPLHIHAVPLLSPVQERDIGLGRALLKRAQQYSAATFNGIAKHQARIQTEQHLKCIKADLQPLSAGCSQHLDRWRKKKLKWEWFSWEYSLKSISKFLRSRQSRSAKTSLSC